MSNTIKPNLRDVKATDLALLAAIVGPKAKPDKAVGAAMRLYLRAAVELDGINRRHIDDLLVHYFNSEDASALLKEWRIRHPLPPTSPDEPPKIFKHYPDRQPVDDEVWQQMNNAVMMGKRPGAALKSMRQFIRAKKDSGHWRLERQKDGNGEWHYLIPELMLSQWRAWTHKEQERVKAQTAARQRQFRAKRRSRGNT